MTAPTRKPKLSPEDQAARNAFIARLVRYEQTPEGIHWRVGPGDQRQGPVGKAIGVIGLKHCQDYEVVLQFENGKIDTFSPMQLFPTPHEEVAEQRLEQAVRKRSAPLEIDPVGDMLEGTWVAAFGQEDDGRPQIAVVKDAYTSMGQPLLDLVFYASDGKKLGRVSDPMGGPRGFEPACVAELWEPIEKPDFEDIKDLFCWGDYLRRRRAPSPAVAEDEPAEAPDQS